MSLRRQNEGKQPRYLVDDFYCVVSGFCFAILKHFVALSIKALRYQLLGTKSLLFTGIGG